jgi:hypothetical protein
VIARFTTIDPHAISYKSLSAYVGNNPINSIDPDGRDLIVLSAPKHVPTPVGPAGHAAVLIGNEKTGYRYYSKNGTTEHKGAYGASNKNPVVGRKYASLKEFEASADNKKDGPYEKAYELKTDEATDKKMEAAAKLAVESDYNVLAESCIDVASDAAKAGNLDPGYTGNSFLGIQNHYLTPVPNLRFDFIIKNNPGGILIILPTPKKERTGTVTVNPAEIEHTVIRDNKQN